MTGATSRAVTDNPFGTDESTHCVQWDPCCSFYDFCVVFCRSLFLLLICFVLILFLFSFVLLFFSLAITLHVRLRCRDSDYPFTILKLFYQLLPGIVYLLILSGYGSNSQLFSISLLSMWASYLSKTSYIVLNIVRKNIKKSPLFRTIMYQNRYSTYSMCLLYIPLAEQ